MILNGFFCVRQGDIPPFLGSCHFEGALILALHISAELFDI